MDKMVLNYDRNMFNAVISSIGYYIDRMKGQDVAYAEEVFNVLKNDTEFNKDDEGEEYALIHLDMETAENLIYILSVVSAGGKELRTDYYKKLKIK